MIFKRKISDDLESNIIKLMEDHKKNLDFAGKALESRNKAKMADKFANGSLMTAGVGMVAVGALAVVGITSAAMFSAGVIAIGAPALACMGISKLIKSYHESVAKKNESDFGYIKAEDSVKSSFENKLNKLLGKELSGDAYKTGLKGELTKGWSLDENTEKLLSMVRDSKNKTEVKHKETFKNTM